MGPKSPFLRLNQFQTGGSMAYRILRRLRTSTDLQEVIDHWGPFTDYESQEYGLRVSMDPAGEKQLEVRIPLRATRAQLATQLRRMANLLEGKPPNHEPPDETQH